MAKDGQLMLDMANGRDLESCCELRPKPPAAEVQTPLHLDPRILLKCPGDGQLTVLLSLWMIMMLIDGELLMMFSMLTGWLIMGFIIVHTGDEF